MLAHLDLLVTKSLAVEIKSTFKRLDLTMTNQKVWLWDIFSNIFISHVKIMFNEILFETQYFHDILTGF